MNEILLYIFILLSFYSCNRITSYDGFDNKEAKYYKSGKTKSIRYWNNLDTRKRNLIFSEKGDTTEYHEEFINHVENTYYYKDSTEHKYYFKWDKDDIRINEWIVYDSNGNILTGSSEYIYIEEMEDSFLVTAITDNFYDLNLILFDRNDTTLTKRDTIFFNQKNQLHISKNTLNDKRLLFVTRMKIDINEKKNSYSIISRRIFVNLPVKLEYQKRIKIKPPSRI